jgi:hypothetical protein
MPIRSRMSQEPAARVEARPYRWLLTKSLLTAVLGFVIAIVAGATAAKAAVALVWGALFFGGFMALFYLCVLAVAWWKEKRSPSTDEISSPRPQPKRRRLVEVLVGSWRRDLLTLGLLVGAALIEPAFAAYIAGYALGLVAITLPTLFGIAWIITRLDRDAPT